MRYSDQDDELERMRSRRNAQRRQTGESYYLDEDWTDEDLEEVPVERRSSRPRRSTRSSASSSSASHTSHASSHTSSYAGARAGASRSSQRSGRPARTQTSSGSAGSANRRVRKKKRPFKLIRNVVIVLLVAVIAYTGWAFLHRPTGIWTVAVFGVDSRDSSVDQGTHADVQMLCTMNRETGEIKLVSVYRDTYMKVSSDGKYHKINQAYFDGGHEQAVEALEENLDLSIDNYATFNWKAVAEGINILGGIDLEITDAEFKYINAFITETVESTGIGSHHLEHSGANHLDGVQAVAYSRLRLMDTDFQRTERQRKVISLALDKAKSADVGTLTTLVMTVLPQLSTDIGVDDLLPMAKDAGKYYIGETAGFPFSRQSEVIGRMDCVVPTTLSSNVKQLHLFLYGDENYHVSSGVEKISQQISQDSGLYEEGEPAPTGSSGGSSSGGGHSSQTAASQETAAVETTPEETTQEETTEAEEETIEELEETEEEEAIEDEEEEEEIGPGVSPSREETTVKETERETVSQTKEDQSGPGVSGPGSSGPRETAAVTEQGPGSDSADSAGPGAAQVLENQGPGVSD